MAMTRNEDMHEQLLNLSVFLLRINCYHHHNDDNDDQKCWAGDMNKRPDFSELRKEIAKLLEDQHG